MKDILQKRYFQSVKGMKDKERLFQIDELFYIEGHYTDMGTKYCVWSQTGSWTRIFAFCYKEH